MALGWSSVVLEMVSVRAEALPQFVKALCAQFLSPKGFHELSEGFNPSREAGLPAKAAYSFEQR